jgi:peroxiredoxin
MATPSNMLALGTQAPDFNLQDLMTGQKVSLKTFADKSLLLVMFLCKHCPYVVHVRGELTKIAQEYEKKGLGIVAITSNDVAKYPDDSPEQFKEMAQQLGWSFPVCYDESQEVARSYDAACTPDFFLFDGARKLIYRGQLDDSRPKNTEPVTGKDLRAAIEAGLKGQPVSGDQKPSMGCNIKWK